MLKKILPVLDWIKRHKYLSVTIVFLFIIVVIDDNNMFKHIRNQAVISELEDEIATMKRDSAEIVKRQNRLDYRGDVDAIEELAREKYDMHKDNEDVFVIE
ncbi:MAG: septum formation initiator family protein [Bacteroidaceae bacterium]|nr:septum formation initiator family protein [Bacteroidaceae bacterium]